MDKNSIKLRFTIVEKHGGPLSKTLYLDDDNILTSDSSDCFIATGKLYLRDTTLRQLADSMETMPDSFGLIPGITDQNEVDLVTREQLPAFPTARARIREHFQWPAGAGAGYVDCDKAMTGEALWDDLVTLMPELEGVEHFHRPSTSSCIYDSAGNELKGITGNHLHFSLADMRQMPRIGNILYKRSWLAGYGYIFISKDGRMLERGLVDQVVYKPEHLMFEAAPRLGDGLEQRRGAPVFVPGKVLEPLEVQDLTDEEEHLYRGLVEQAKARKKPEADAIREQYLGVQIEQLMTREPTLSEQVARQVVLSRFNGVLIGDDILQFDDGQNVTINDVLLDPSAFDGKTLRDPLEPDYGKGKARLYMNGNPGQPIINSLSHGQSHFYHLRMDVKGLLARIEAGDSDQVKAHWQQWATLSRFDELDEEVLIDAIMSALGLKSGKRTIRKALKLSQQSTGSLRNEDVDNLDVEVDRNYSLTSARIWLNKGHGFVMYESKAFIIKERWDKESKHYKPTFIRAPEMSNYYANWWVPVKPNDDESPFVQPFDKWLLWPNRRTYAAVEFVPDASLFRSSGRELPNGDAYNVWQGYAIRPIAGDCEPILEHLYNVWCGGVDEQYNYLLNWTARLFKRPELPAETSIVLQSVPGAGKNIIVDQCYMPPFGIHGMMLTQGDHLVGRFNAHLGYNVLTFANEAIWGGHKEKAGVLKSLITDPFRTLEPKFKDATAVRNYTHLMIATNEDWAAPMDLDDRRFLMLECSGHRKGDSEYFNKLMHNIENGGREAFFRQMLDHDLTGFDVRQLPEHQSARKLTSQLAGAPLYMQWFVGLLMGDDIDTRLPRCEYTGAKRNAQMFYVTNNGTVVDSWEDGMAIIHKDDFFELYQAFEKQHRPRTPLSKDIFCRLLHQKLGEKLMKSVQTKKGPVSDGGAQRRAIRLPPQGQARKLFEERTRHRIAWPPKLEIV